MSHRCSLFPFSSMVAVMLLLAWQAQSAAAQTGNANIVREFSGRILYSGIPKGEPRGEEWWRMSVHPDGSRTIRMSTKIDETKVARDVTLRIDAKFRPIEHYQSLWVEGVHRGSGLFRVQDGQLLATVFGPSGRLEQTLPAPPRMSFVSHPLGGDGWHFWDYDFARGGRQQTAVYNTDTYGRGIGSILGRLETIDIELLGEEKLTTPAGSFDTWRFQMTPEFIVWVDKAERFLVRMDAHGTRRYVLTELRREYQ